MSGSTTPNYGFGLPTIGGNQDSWGNVLNANWSSLDTLLHNAASTAFLPLTGGTISGSLSVHGALQVNASLGCAGALQIGYPTISDFFIAYGDPNAGPDDRKIQWADHVNSEYSTAYGQFNWWNHGIALASMYSDGGFNISGNAWKPGGGSWAAGSDERIKRNIEPYQAGLDEVCRLRPISFEYNGAGDTGPLADGTRYRGLVAQAAREVMPELVCEMPHNKDCLPGQLGTELGPLTLALCNAVRELRDRIVVLEADSA
jgi:hypothetical protein